MQRLCNESHPRSARSFSRLQSLVPPVISGSVCYGHYFHFCDIVMAIEIGKKGLMAPLIFSS